MDIGNGHYRPLDAFEERDRLSLFFSFSAKATTHVSVMDKSGEFVARASYSQDEYARTFALLHLHVVGRYQKKGIGSSLLRLLYHDIWRGKHVRIWNPAPKAVKFYQRLGFYKRTSEIERGEMWFRTALMAAGGAPWPTVEAPSARNRKTKGVLAKLA